MKPNFIQPAFIRKNTRELRKKLEELGYEHPADIIEDERFCIATSPISCKYFIIIKEAFDDTNPHRTWNCAGRIDCGTNEYLFLAIAALREDTNNNQLFTNGIDWAIYRDNINNIGLSGFDYYNLPHDIRIPLNKASVKEIIEYFKKEE